MEKSGRRGQSDLPRHEEQDLIVQARNGSPAAIELLVSRYESRIFRLARNISPERICESFSKPGRVSRRFPFLYLARTRRRE